MNDSEMTVPPGDVTIHVKAHCGFCNSDNELTIRYVPSSNPVTCSACGGGLGTLGELAHDGGIGKPGGTKARATASIARSRSTRMLR